MTRHNGFTIVELLIVIVVIGILAAIVIVAFNGVQERANNAAKYEAASNYNKALLSYIAMNSSYPPMGQPSVCLGLGYSIKIAGDTAGACGGSDYTTKEDTTFNTAIKQILNKVPQANDKAVTKADGQTFVGIRLTKWDDFKVDSISNPYFIEFALDGSNKDCTVSGVVRTRPPAHTWGDMIPAAPEKNSFYDSKSTTCVVALPNP